MMASYRKKNRTKPWLARRHRNGIEYMLGYHETREEAEEAEAKFDVIWPRPKPTGKRGEYAYGL